MVELETGKYKDEEIDKYFYYQNSHNNKSGSRNGFIIYEINDIGHFNYRAKEQIKTIDEKEIEEFKKENGEYNCYFSTLYVSNSFTQIFIEEDYKNRDIEIKYNKFKGIKDESFC